jgi:predicted nucleic acid-binding protein
VIRLRYVETSALLRALLEGDEPMRRLLAGTALATSALTFLEATRAIARARRDRRLDARGAREAQRQLSLFQRSCAVVAIDDQVLELASGEFPVEPVRSLDAIHLASLRLLERASGSLEVVSCDERVRRNTVAFGLALLPADEGVA